MKIGILSSSPENEIRKPLRSRQQEEADVARALRRYSSREGARVPIAAVAAMCGLSRETVYQAMHGNMGEIARTVLTSAIARIEHGEIRFRRYGNGYTDQGWEVLERPARLPAPQPRLVLASDYVEWAICASCGCPRFSPFEGLAGQRFMGCDGCLGQSDRGMLGAK